MKTINILGYSENIFPLLIESFKCKFPNQDIRFNIIQNIDLTITKSATKLIKDNYINICNIQDHDFIASDFNILGVFSPNIKAAIFNEFKETHNISKKTYYTLIHPTSVIGFNSKLHHGIYIEPLSIVSPLARIEFGVSINRNSSIGHHTRINEFSTIAPGVNIGGNCDIADYVTVGIGTTIFNNVKIGSNSIIGGGSVVTKDIPSDVIAYGNPCLVKRKI